MKWLLIIIVLIVISILVLPVFVLHTIFESIISGLKNLFGDLSYKVNAATNNNSQQITQPNTVYIINDTLTTTINQSNTLVKSSPPQIVIH
jgi:flagellar basal body-associated protein FliL